MPLRRQLLRPKERYLLRDGFNLPLDAGAVTNTFATPLGEKRVSVDTNAKISIANGVLNFATGAAANDGVWWSTQARVAGKMLLVGITPSDTNGIVVVGWDTNQTGAINDALQFAAGGAIKIIPNGGTAITVGSYTATSYRVAAIMRSTGVFWYIYGGAFTKWNLLWITAAGTATAFPAVQAGDATSVFTVG